MPDGSGRAAGCGRRHKGGEGAVLQVTRITLCLLAQRIEQLTEQIHGLERRLALLAELKA